MNNFSYNIPTRVHFGKAQLNKLREELAPYKNILIVYGTGSIKKQGLYYEVIDICKSLNLNIYELPDVVPNPRISSVNKGVEICKSKKVDFILAVGAGSVIDAAKAIAFGFYHTGNAWDFFTGKARITKALPIGTILSLAATGSEMNGNTVITNDETSEKLATGHPCLYPVFSILDPTYTFSVPKTQTAAGVADIMSHVFEQYFSPTTGTFIQDRLSEAILQTCIHYGPIAIAQPNNYEARANLMWAGSLALNGLLSYGKKTDWATHLIEHELSAKNDLTHGVGLAILTPHWMQYVLNENTLDKFVQYGKNVWNLSGDEKQIANLSIQATRDFFNLIGIPCKLSEVGFSENDLTEIAEKASNAGYKPGLLGSFKELQVKDIHNILLLSL